MKNIIVVVLALLATVSAVGIAVTANVTINYVNKYITILDPPKPATEADIDILIQLLPATRNKSVSTFYMDLRETLKLLGKLGEVYPSIILKSSNVLLFKALYGDTDAYVFVVLDYGPHFENLTKNILYVINYSTDNYGETRELILNPGARDETIVRINGIKRMPRWLEYMVLYLLGGTTLDNEELGFIILREAPDLTLVGNIDTAHPIVFYKIIDVYHANYDILQSTIKHMIRIWNSKGYVARINFIKGDLIEGLQASTYNNYIIIASASSSLTPLAITALYFFGRNVVRPKISKEIFLLRSLGVPRKRIIMSYVRIATVFTLASTIVLILTDRSWIELLPTSLAIPARISEATALVYMIAGVTVLGVTIFSRERRKTSLSHRNLLVVSLITIAFLYFITLVLLPLSPIISSTVQKILAAITSFVVSVIAVHILIKTKSRSVPLLSSVYSLAVLITVVVSMVIIPAVQISNDIRSIEAIVSEVFPEWIHNITFAYADNVTENNKLLWYRLTHLYVYKIGEASFITIKTYGDGAISALIRGDVKPIIVSDALLKQLGLEPGTAYVILPPQSLTVATNNDLFKLVEEMNDTIQPIYLWSLDYPNKIQYLGKVRITVLRITLGLWMNERVSPAALPPQYIRFHSSYEKPSIILSRSIAKNLNTIGGLVAFVNIGVSSFSELLFHPVFVTDYDFLRTIYAERLYEVIASSSTPSLALLSAIAVSVATVEVLGYIKQKNLYLKYLRSIGASSDLVTLWKIRSLLLMTATITLTSALTSYLNELTQVSFTFLALSIIATLLYILTKSVERRLLIHEK